MIIAYRRSVAYSSELASYISFRSCNLRENLGKILCVNDIFSPLCRGLCLFMQTQQVSYILVSLEDILKRLINSASCACALLEYYILQTVCASCFVATPGMSFRLTTALQYKFRVRLLNISLDASTDILTPLWIAIFTVDLAEICSVCV
jgi:hypothetical protein